MDNKSPVRQGQRNPEDIHICILTQTESQVLQIPRLMLGRFHFLTCFLFHQASGLSTIQVTIDGQAPELENIAIETTAQMFVQQSIDTYKATQVNISMFINILIGIKANGWTLMGTNAFLNSAKQEVVKTFYFEKISGRSSSSSSSSAAANNGMRSSVNNAVAINNKNNSYVTTPLNTNNGGDALSPMITRDRMPSVEGKSSVETVEQRIAAITAAQNARKSFLLKQQQQSDNKTSPVPTSSSRETDDSDLVGPADRREETPGGASLSPVGGAIFNITPRAKSTTPGARTAGVSSTTGGASSDIQKKNAEYFKRMKQEQDLEKKKQEEEESKLDEAEQRRRKEQKALQEAHENSKTAHFSRLGATFVTGGGLFGDKKKSGH